MSSIKISSTARLSPGHRARKHADGMFVNTRPRGTRQSKQDHQQLVNSLGKDSQLVEPPAQQQLTSKLEPNSGGGGGSSVLACTLLVAGSAVGAGMLALPTVTAPAGFEAAACALVGGCAYSVVTGLLMAEVTINALEQRQASSSSSSSSSSASSNVSLTSIALPILGSGGVALVIAPYLFLHYSLLVAYIAKAGELVAGWLGIPFLQAAVLFTAVFGGGCYTLSSQKLDALNGALVLVLVASFLGLLGIAAQDLDPARLQVAEWSKLPPTLPVIALAFVFQNIVPVIVQRLDCDRAKVRASIFAGMGISLVMFMLWDGAILGSSSAAAPGAVLDPLSALRAATPLADPLIQAFSFLAVSTSFLGFVLSLTDFLADAASGTQGQSWELERKAPPARPVLFLAVLAPPAVLAVFNPTIFFAALDSAGAYGVMTLFGILPAVLAWQQRYSSVNSLDNLALDSLGVELVPGGKPVLLVIALVAAGVITNQLFSQLLPFFT